MQILQPAPTLKDLRNRIDEAIAIAGEEGTWKGFDDEAVSDGATIQRYRIVQEEGY
jgi:hypothetical protein